MRSSAKIVQLATFLILSLEADSSFQLIDSSSRPIVDSREGLLLYNGGTVCDDSFTDNSASAICKEMGFDFAKSWSVGLNWPSQSGYSIALDDVVCSAPYWSSCTYRTTNDCGHREDVFLTCSCSTVSCPPGKYQSSCKCMNCPSDSYKSTEGTQSFCTPCPGTSTSKPGSRYCSCNAGMFWNETRSQCESCTQGFTSPKGSLQCLTCPPGSIVFNKGTSCSCPDGMVWNWIGQLRGSCRSCSPGTYKNSKTPSCTVCPPATFSQVGSDHCICQTGRFWNETICQDCSEGTVSQKGASQCLPCPIGSKALDTRSCTCPVGMAWTWDETDQGSCKPCQPGTYKSDQMMSCISCPPDTTSTLGSGHCSCRAGMFWNETSCQNCSQGLVSRGGALECLSCPKGSIALNRGSACSCPGGKIWDWTEHFNGSCKPCQPGTYNNDQVTSCQVCPSGSTSISGSDHCLCNAGMFWNNTRCDDCAEGAASPRGALHCLTCPPGSTSDKERTLCSCPFGKSWSWDDHGEGSCSLVSLSLITGLVLICTSGVLALISLTLGIVLVSQKLKTEKDVNKPAKVSYAVEGDVEISCDQRSGMQCSGEDLIISQPGQEVYSVMESAAESSFSGANDIYNCLIKE